MKKSILRKLIKESIKELINEQTGNTLQQVPNSRMVEVVDCDTPGFSSVTTIGSMTINGQAPQEGDIFTQQFCDYDFISGQMRSTIPIPGRIRFVKKVLGPGDVNQGAGGNMGHYYATGDQRQAFNPTSTQPGAACFRCISNYPPNLAVGNGFSGVIDTSLIPAGGCQDVAYNASLIRNACKPGAVSTPSPNIPSIQIPIPGTNFSCDRGPNAPFPSNFDMSSWTNTWLNLGPFNSSNPNQPCNFVCGKRNQWTNQLNAGGMGPAQTNMISCKLLVAESQYQTHNCINSNANNCP